MAGEVINLATFQLDTNRLQTSLNELQDTYFDLKKAQKEYSDQSKETAKQIDLLQKSQKALSEASGDNSEAIDENEKQLQDLLKTQKELYKSEQNLGIQMGTVRKEINQTTTQLRAYQDAEGKTASLIDLGNQALNRQIKNKNDARAANIALNNVVNQLNPNIQEEKDLMIQLNDQIDKNTEFIKENSSASGKQSQNIGNYKSDIEEALKAQQDLNDGLGGFIVKASESGGAGAALTSTFTTIRVGILGALKAGLAFIATPIGAAIAALAVTVGAVVGAFKLAKASLQSTEEGTQKLAIITGTISGVFRGLFNIVKPLGLFFANVFIKTLENVGKVAELTAKGIASVLEFVGAESAAKGIRNFTNEVKASGVAAANLARAEGELVVQQRNARKTQLDYQKAAEKLRQQRDDETNSISKRIAINNQLGQVLQKQSAAELAIANKQLQVANLRIKAEGKTTEALNARAEAQTNISDIQERIAGQESEQLANLNSLRKEASDAEKERRQKAADEALARSKSDLDLFIANQGFKKKSAEEEYAFNKNLFEKQSADLKLQLSKQKITQEEYNAQLTQLKVDLSQKNASLAVENAELELQAELDKNARILDSDKFLSQEQYNLKKQALDNDLLAQQEYEKKRLENGAINQAQYNAEINRINEENRRSNEELALEREAAAKEKSLIDLENQKIAQEENFIAQIEIEQAQNEIKRQQEIANAEKTGADISLINEKYAQLDTDINKKVLDAKLTSVADTFGNISKILGENSKAGKAAAIAQATINTYQGVTAAWMAPAVLPQPFDSISKIAASGVALVSGIKAVKQITATKTPSGGKTPSYASGVIGLRGVGSGTSDQVNLNASAGESIITARATSMFPRELAAINQAGGGVGLNGSSNVLTQTNIEQSANNAQMVQMIANAVAAGAEAGTSKGSQKGIKELSADRKIMNDAKF